MNNLTVAIFLIVLAQFVTYLQLQSQFVWTWAKDHPLVLALVGFPVSLILIYYTRYCAAAFEGQVWPGRLIGFAVGAIVFAICSRIMFSESLTVKTGVCLILSVAILMIQIFWK